MPGRATVKEESRSHSHHEEVCDETVLANSTEPDAHFDGFLDIHPNPIDMAICQMENRPHRIPPRTPDDLLGAGGDWRGSTTRRPCDRLGIRRLSRPLEGAPDDSSGEKSIHHLQDKRPIWNDPSPD